MSELNSLNKTKENVTRKMVESPFLEQKEGQSWTKMGHGWDTKKPFTSSHATLPGTICGAKHVIDH